MNDTCMICGIELHTAPEIEQGACYEHLEQDSIAELDDIIEPLNFDEGDYFGVADSESPIGGRNDDGC